MKIIAAFIITFLASVFAVNAQTKPKLTYEEKEQIEIYKARQFTKVESNWHEPLQGKQWPQFTDAQGNRYTLNITITRNNCKNIEAQFYKVNNDLSITPYLCFESNSADYFIKRDGSSVKQTFQTFIDKEGNILFFDIDRNGPILFRITKEGVCTAIAGHSYHRSEIKDGKMNNVWFNNSEGIITQTKDGNIFIKEKADKLVDMSDTKTEYGDYILRVITLKGEVKTIKDKEGKPFIRKIYSNIITTNNEANYMEKHILKKFTWGQIIEDEEYLAGTEIDWKMPRYAAKAYKLGPANKTFWGRVFCLSMGNAGEIYLHSYDSERILMLKDNIVTNFCGKSNFSKWLGGIQQTATAGIKAGNAKTAEVAGTQDLIVMGGFLYACIKSQGRLFTYMKIDKQGNATIFEDNIKATY